MIGFPVPATRPVADAVIVTEPARLPVTVRVATPATALLEPNPVRLPVPEVCAKVTLRVSEVMVLPKASSMVAVSARMVPDDKLPVEPLTASLFAAAALTTTVSVPGVVMAGPSETTMLAVSAL